MDVLHFISSRKRMMLIGAFRILSLILPRRLGRWPNINPILNGDSCFPGDHRLFGKREGMGLCSLYFCSFSSEMRGVRSFLI